ncbi:uncharacterized protein FFB20_01789 [Fusarium fujikuroi]|uniref:Uncharacterized protein n=2 Tax=Fusarium fujikuroi TaxID=5127 RepID=S0DUH0_GIBF5|nr:uncharacterized protein FFUJ_03245 [Fusarium fujikuroi IMI 58289]KLO89762.1 uncharacterized protein LW93_1824 [Fusarium fujikuroi]KLP01788.1 uncharacterized protein Y057_14166 [Fusarium fujikuroi]KLP19592.1 uncharacterized protein LW94_12670 [Fusarium fujikuroi]QGI62426.1 hypothetical protein CEK27_006397 [Fusarium fujikuroi]QGI79595.1 hypothetical protein CEK25_006324 [Fusarium fujikuroi]
MAWFTIILQAFGFTSKLLGSFAAWIQSLIGNVVTGSLFATLQSAAMGGFGVGILVKAVSMIFAFVCYVFGRLAYSAFGQP